MPFTPFLRFGIIDLGKFQTSISAKVKKSKCTASKCVKIVDFARLEYSKLISHKI